MAPAHLRVEGLEASYGETHVLRNVNLNVAAGEVVCLIGRNGVGKTTLLKSIVGLVHSGGGSIHLDDREITLLAPKVCEPTAHKRFVVLLFRHDGFLSVFNC